jgi:hypothetical protein
MPVLSSDDITSKLHTVSKMMSPKTEMTLVLNYWVLNTER